MPNWCENRVEIDFDTLEDKKTFINRCLSLAEDDDGYVLDFHKIRPLGLGEDQNGKPNWDYHIAVQLWGTKWALNDSVIPSDWVKDDEDLWCMMHFDTAWAPPDGIFNELSSMFDDSGISWFYDEPGMQFAGYLNNEN